VGGPPATQHFEGLFRGLGKSSKEPVCNKRNTTRKRAHDTTHFAVGCKQWEDDGGGKSMAHQSFADPGIVYATYDAPDKNMSAVDLRQGGFNPKAHFQTEQRDRFAYSSQPPREPAYKHQPTVHLGDDRPELIAQSRMVHCPIGADDAQRATSLRAAGAGTLVPTSVWPKPVRCNPVNGGARNVDLQDLGMADGMRFPRRSHNSSVIVMDANVRDPINGYHIPAEAHGSTVNPNAASTVDIVHHVNRSVPHLRSLGALRPPNY